MEPQLDRRSGLAALSLPGRVIAAIAVAVVAVTVAVHLAMVFLHVAPENTLSAQHSSAIDDYVYPEFEQNWKLFAPNPLQQNIAVHARAEITRKDGTSQTTGWVDLTAMDGANIRGNLAPSHTVQNELRRAWDFYRGSHDDKERPSGLRGELSTTYVKRIVMQRLGTQLNGGLVERLQIRSSTTRVAPPPWSGEKWKTDPEYDVLPWWDIDETDLSGSTSK